MKIFFTLLLSFLIVSQVQSQTIYNEIPLTAFENYCNSYNYTFWDDNFKSTITGPRKFTIQTSSFSMNVNYDDLTIQSLNINQSNQQANDAFAASKASIFPVEYGGNIDFAVLQNGVMIHEKRTNPTSFGPADSQMAEYGTWLNRRFVSTYFTNNPGFDFYYTGVEFTNWHNRLKMTLHVKPTVNVANGQLQFEVEIPAIYNNLLDDGTTYAFADGNDAGFAVQGGTSVDNFILSGNTITVTTASQELVANTSYEVSLVLYAATENLSTTYMNLVEEDDAVNVLANQTLPNQTQHPLISYEEDEGIHYLDIARYGMGYTNCGQVDVLQNIEVSLENTAAVDKRVRLCFRQIPNVNVVGFNSILRNNNLDPSGFPLQVSKNWHDNPKQLYSGFWIREYTEIAVPANSTVNLNYTRTGAKWGETYSASSHQLSVVGAGIPKGGWLEAALGSFGESITHSPDYLYGNSNICDFRPFMVTNEAYQGTSTECSWTGNVGGMDMWVYTNDNNERIFQKEVKTRFQRYSPNLTETSISAISADEKLKLDYSFYLNRSDDFIRVYYKIKIKALAQTPFNRFDIFQLGGDIYNLYQAQNVIYGDVNGVLGQFNPINDGSNDYTNTALAMPGEDPWIWAGNGTIVNGFGGINIETNNGIIVKDYNAVLGGLPSNVPYFRERSSSQGFAANWGQSATSYCLVPPPNITSFTPGDSIELVLESVVLPKLNGDYYGDNTNFANALATYGNSMNLFLREVQGNNVILSSSSNAVDNTYPYSVASINNTAMVTVTGGRSYVAIIFEGLTDVSDPVLWRSENDCWELVDQSTWGKDFWQADYQCDSGTFDLIYNVNQDIVGDGIATITYYLGDTPPTPNIIVQTNYNFEGWSLNNVVEVYLDDYAHFAPQVQEAGVTTVGDGVWSWTGPNGYTSNSRNIQITSITEADLGTYVVTYTAPYGCVTTQVFELVCVEPDINGACQLNACSGFIAGPHILTGSNTVDENFWSQIYVQSNAMLAIGIEVSYKGAQYVELNADFEVPLGTNFCGEIDDCNAVQPRIEDVDSFKTTEVGID